jgi:iron complex transport system substrate-binding protein
MPIRSPRTAHPMPWLAAPLTLLTLALSACGGGTPPPQAAVPGPTSAPQAAVAGPTSAPRSTPAQSSPATPGAAATQTVTDMYGASVTVPTRIDRIADGWPAHNSLLLMLGVANKLVATTPIVQAYPWFLRIDPGIASLPGVFGTTVHNEQLVQTKPDVVFLSQTDDNTVKSIRGLGLPLVQVYFTDFAQLEACFQLTGQVLGGGGRAVSGHAVRELPGRAPGRRPRADRSASARTASAGRPPE